MARRLPKSFTSTPEEDEYFEKEKAASAAPVEEEEVTEEESEPAPEEEAAPEAEEEATEEAPAEGEEGAAEADSEDTPSRTVPIGALHEEREKRKQLQAKIDQMEATFEKFAARLNQQSPLQPPAPTAPEPPAIPAYDEDPVAHLKARIDQLTQLSTGTHQMMQQQHAMAKLGEAIGIFDAQMRAKAADYDQAIEFAKRSRDSELAALGYVDPEQRMELMRQEILGTAAYCIQRGQNPAEAFYNYAKVRGWKGPNGEASSAASQSPAKRLATVAKAQAAAGKAIPRGGVAPKPAVTLADLATMEDDEFDKHFDRVMRKT